MSSAICSSVLGTVHQLLGVVPLRWPSRVASRIVPHLHGLHGTGELLERREALRVVGDGVAVSVLLPREVEAKRGVLEGRKRLLQLVAHLVHLAGLEHRGGCRAEYEAHGVSFLG